VKYSDIRKRAQPTIDRLRRGEDLHREAEKQGYATLSEYLEREDPSDDTDRRLGMDAFKRALIAAEIRTSADAEGRYMADPVEKFGDSKEGQALFSEWVRRVAEQARSKRAPAQFMSQDFVLGTIQRPYNDDPTLRQGPQVVPAIPLAEVVARTRLNDGPDYRGRIVDMPAAASVRMRRVAEGAEIPAVRITERQVSIWLPKFGYKVVGTYEAARRMGIDQLAEAIQQVSLRTEVDEVEAAVDVLINGDGNTNTAAEVIALTTLDPATTANNLTVTAWINFLTQWTNPYQMTSVVGQQASMMKLLMLNMGTANALLAGGFNTGVLAQNPRPMNQSLAQGWGFGIMATAPSAKLVGFDRRYAVERVIERGSQINEAERWITRQTEEMTFTINEGYAVLNTESAKVLNLAA
jgi:hypothetical protein